ncbi:Myrcene synthase [Handroanthus impetiginosus]|uniref:Myrcene synthase n=1 Tax=Handroanthus impetiginosus TaxID=429701 RepID=A0A2G9GQ31_9LAMI|nr:Myrcene synthase [Handroanthus impetiginosus]
MQLALPTKPHTNYTFPCKGGQCVSKPCTCTSSNVSKKIMPCSIKASATTTPSFDQTTTICRRCGNYKPSLWDFDFIQSLNGAYMGECYVKRASELKQQVNRMLQEGAIEQFDQLELIDNFQNLGIAPHFQYKIKQILESIYQSNYGIVCATATHQPKQIKNLHAKALEFGLLRQHGFHVPQEIFDRFKNEKGDFKASLGDDTKGLLQLYEASFLLTEGESSLELAREFTISIFLYGIIIFFVLKSFNLGVKCFRRYYIHVETQNDDFNRENSQWNEEMKYRRSQHDVIEKLNNIDDDNLSSLVCRALELPRHCILLHANVRWFLDAYGRRPDMNPTLFELTKLDFNIYQANVQQELKHISRHDLYLYYAKRKSFYGNTDMSSFMYNIYIGGHERILATKIIMLGTILDDKFDVYATLEELQLFCDVIQRWDLESIEKLPIYMQTFFVALNNNVNEIAYHILKQQGVVIIPHLRKTWVDLCEAYMKEAIWYNNGVQPSLEEYLNNAWISVAVPTFLYQVYFLVTNPIEKEAIKYLDEYHNIIRWSSMITRLADDIATAGDELERGDVSKSIQCYMNETGASDQKAQKAMRLLIWEAWKKLNTDRISSINLARVGQSMYQYGDGFGCQHFETKNKDRIMSMLFDPIA